MIGLPYAPAATINARVGQPLSNRPDPHRDHRTSGGRGPL